QSLQFLDERCDAGRFRTALRKRLQHADAFGSLVLLCSNHERHRHRATNKSNEFSPLHLRAQSQLKHGIGSTQATEGTPRHCPNVSFGSKADMCTAPAYVRFAPESGHVRCTSARLLWARSGHGASALFFYFRGPHSAAEARRSFANVTSCSAGPVASSLEPATSATCSRGARSMISRKISGRE